jgi:hypothetical protein
MPKKRARPEQIFRNVGRLVVAWNDLELHVRRVLFALTDTHEHFVSVAVLTADMQADALLKALKAVAKEHDTFHTKFNLFLGTLTENTNREPGQIELISEHVEHLYKCADRLRLYRNYYAHGITSPVGKESYTLGKLTARGGLLVYDSPIKIHEIIRTIAAISRTIRYARGLERRLNHRVSGKGKQPPWPAKIPIPAEHKKRSNSPLTNQLPVL